MSKIIKASRITGEYKLSDVKIEKKIQKKNTDIDKLNENKNESNKNNKLNKIQKRIKNRKDKIITEAEEEAKKIIENAKKDASKIKEKAEKEGYDNGYQKGKDEGYEEGLEQGYEEAKNKAQQKLKDLNTISHKIDDYFERELENLPAEIIELAVKIASKIVNKELDFNPELINNIIFDLLEEIGETHQDIVIKISPDLENYINEVDIENYLNHESMEFIADESLSAGDCIIETEYGGKDATIENKLELIEKKLLQGAGYNEKG